MSADIYTEITMKGTPEELLAMLLVLRRYGTELKAQHSKKRDCAYLQAVSAAAGERGVFGVGGWQDILSAKDQQLSAFLAEAGGTVSVGCNGPYGVFVELSEVRFFEEMAKAAPGAWFKGEISGFTSGEDVGRRGELRDGKLYLSDYFMPFEYEEYDPDDDESDNYMAGFYAFQDAYHPKDLYAWLKIDTQRLDMQADEDVGLLLGCYDAGFPDIDYPTFRGIMDGLDALHPGEPSLSSIREEEFNDVIARIRAGELTPETDADDAPWWGYVYDPVTGEYER